MGDDAGNNRHDASGNRQLALIGAGFGLTLFAEIYVLGILLGGWLDQRLGSKPLFTLAGVLLALFGSFYQLYRMLNAAEAAQRGRAQAKKPPDSAPPGKED